MYIRSISPIVASILIIVITVAIAGIFYAFTSGMFSSLSSSSNNLVNQQSKVISFTINNVYCSNNIIYFNIYNKGNIPININNSLIIFTDNNGNTISINGSNIICNNGNIIPSGNSELCYIINNSCYYNVTNYIKSINFVYNGISYSYNVLNNNKFNLLYVPNNTTSIISGYIPITIYNTQNIPTPAPFQQDIAICNGSINIGNNFVYINNVTLFNQINPNGQNVLFFNPNINQLLYSWYEGQLINGSTYCDIWWINISNGIPANSNITIYMYIGNSSTNYYSQYYPYVGASPQVISGYDNGNYTFIAYGYFDNTMDGWTGYNYSGSWIPTATSSGIQMVNWYGEGTYILPPNNWNIPKIPMIVEEAWYYGGEFTLADANVIALFGNTSQQISAGSVGSTDGGGTPASNLSTYVQFEYYPGGPGTYLKSAVTNSILSQTSFPTSGGTVYSYLIVNSSYAQTGYYIYNSNQVWIPLTILNTYNVNYNIYTYSNLNYNPFQYSTLEIGAGTGGHYSYQYVQWIVARAYPPNGVMPSIYIS